MTDFRMAEVLDAWDTLMTYTSYEPTPKRQAWLRKTYEIEGSLDDWLDNKFNNIVDEYATQRNLTIDAALAELRERPVKPWKGSTLPASAPTMVHLAVQGPKNITTIGIALPEGDEALDRFAGMVADRKPGKRYYIVTATTPKQILYRWHVGEGMEHKDGWWVE